MAVANDAFRFYILPALQIYYHYLGDENLWTRKQGSPVDDVTLSIPIRYRISSENGPNDLELYKGLVLWNDNHFNPKPASESCAMSVFNSFSGSCQSATTSNISEYYNTVGEYVKSTLPQYTNNDQIGQHICVLSNNNEINLCPEQYFNNNLKAQYGYTNMTECVPNYHVPQSRHTVSQNTPFLYNVPFLQRNNSNAGVMYRHFSHTKNPSLKVNMKKKRRRTIFTTEQIIALEAVFQKKPYISREERVMMMQKLQVTEKSIKIWFQNRRRLTDKNKGYLSDSPSSDDSSDTINDRLAYIESHIQRNTDDYGYVTLDDNVMGDLVNIIDEYLSQDVSWDVSPMYNQQTTIVQDESSKYIVMYEPISPVSLSEALDDV